MVTFLAMTSVRRLGSSWNANAEKVLGGATTEPAVSRPSRSMEVDVDMASSGADGVAGGGSMGVEGAKIAGSDGIGVDGAGDGGGITVRAPGGDGTGTDGVGITGTGGEGAGGGSPGEDAGGTTGAAGDCGVGEGTGRTTGVACGDGVDGASVGGAGVGGVDVGGDAAAATPVVVAAEGAGEDAQMESSLAKISAMVEDAVAGRAAVVGSAAGANLRLMAATNPAHVGTPMFLSTQQYH